MHTNPKPLDLCNPHGLYNICDSPISVLWHASHCFPNSIPLHLQISVLVVCCLWWWCLMTTFFPSKARKQEQILPPASWSSCAIFGVQIIFDFQFFFFSQIGHALRTMQCLDKISVEEVDRQLGDGKTFLNPQISEERPCCAWNQPVGGP